MLLGVPGHTQPKVVVLHAAFPWWISPCKEIDALPPETTIIRKSCNLIGQEHFGLFSQIWDLYRKSYNAFHFRLLPAKTNDKGL